MKYPKPMTLQASSLPPIQKEAIENISDLLVDWTDYALTTLRGTGVGPEDRAPIIAEILLIAAAAVVISHDDRLKLSVDVRGFQGFSAACFSASLNDLREKRGDA
jgi:hypothetical protein